MLGQHTSLTSLLVGPKACSFKPFITYKSFLCPFPKLCDNDRLRFVNTLIFFADWPDDNLDNYRGDYVVNSTALGRRMGDGIYFTASKFSPRMVLWVGKRPVQLHIMDFVSFCCIKPCLHVYRSQN